MKRLLFVTVFALTLFAFSGDSMITPDGFDDDDHFPEYVVYFDGITPDGFDDDHFPEYVVYFDDITPDGFDDDHFPEYVV